MAKVLPTICVSDKDDDSGLTYIINKSDFDPEKHDIQRRELTDENPEESDETGSESTEDTGE